jgi:hypothetical protein
MAHAQKPGFVFRRKGRVHLNRRGRQFSRLLTAEVCASAVVMLDTPCSEVVWRVLATHSIRQFPLHFPSRASPCAITFQLDSTSVSSCGSSWWLRRSRWIARVSFMISEASSFTVAGYDILEALRTSQRCVQKRWVCAFTYLIPRLTVAYKARHISCCQAQSWDLTVRLTGSI